MTSKPSHAKNTLEFSIEGMTCRSCEVLIERKFLKIPGIQSAKVSQVKGKATVTSDGVMPSIQELQKAIAPHGYRIVDEAEASHSAKKTKSINSGMTGENTLSDDREIGVVAVIIVGVYFLLKNTSFLDFRIGITENMGYGFIFLVGLVAASSSCIAVTGGVLLSLAAKYQETYQPVSRIEKFKPHLLFNLGRIISYTVLGGMLGALGSVFSLSSLTTGIITVVASLFMILMGLKILKVFPRLHQYLPGTPKFISHGILKLEKKEGRGLVFLIGALTFFLPCGFTQSFQLFAVSRGNFLDGALTMFFFSLGTLPALLSLGAVSSLSKGKFQRYFLKFSGVLLLILGIGNIQNGFALTGITPSNRTFSPNTVSNGANSTTEFTSDSSGKIVNGKQVVDMRIEGYSYTPSQFTVVQGIPVEWRILNAGAAGCGQIINVPSLGIMEFIPENETKVLTFTPSQTGIIPFNCSMGMMTPDASFKVIGKS